MKKDQFQYVYILYNDFIPYVYKIGWTSRDPRTRAIEISKGTGVVGEWKVAHFWNIEDGYWLEQRIFKEFSQYRLPRSEMFHFGGYSVEQISDLISQFIHNTGKSKSHMETITAKNHAEEMKRQQWESEELQKKMAYSEECKRIKNEINRIIIFNVQKELKDDKKLKSSFYSSTISYGILGCVVGVFADHIITWALVGIIIGYISYHIEKNKKYHALIKQNSKSLPNDIDQLRMLKSRLTNPHT